MRFETRKAAAAAVTAAVYAILTIVLAPVSFGPLQFRVAEALCILPFFMPCTVSGLFLGCLIANIFSGNILDIIFGSAATLLSCALIARLGKGERTAPKKILACLVPAPVNALIVGAVITKGYMGLDIFTHGGAFLLNAGEVCLGELGVMLIIGLPLMLYLPRRNFFNGFVHRVNFGGYHE